MEFEFRFGINVDAPQVADLVIAAGDGLFESLLDGVVPGVGAREFVRMAVNAEESPLSYSNAILAEADGKLAGMALGYPATEYSLPPVLKSLLPNRRLDPLRALFESKIEDSWYLNSLAVLEQARGRGLGRILVQACGEVAQEAGFPSISLHAWKDNAAALSVYQSLGFVPVEDVAVSLRTRPERECGMVLLNAPLPLRA